MPSPNEPLGKPKKPMRWFIILFPGCTCVYASPQLEGKLSKTEIHVFMPPIFIKYPTEAFAQMEGIISIRDPGRRARRKVRESGDEAVSGFSRVGGTEQRCWDTPASLSAPELRKQAAGFGNCPEEIYPPKHPGWRAAPEPALILRREIPLDWGRGSKDTALGLEGPEEGLETDHDSLGLCAR